MLLFQIKWENRLINDDGSPCKVSVDGTDFRTVEWKPFNSARKSHKFNGPGLRYEVVIAIKTGFIVSLNGPFLCGSHPDLRIARQWLHNVLPPGEFYVADGGYRDKHGPSVVQSMVPENEIRAFKLIRARHETVNGRFKEWKILGNTCRHHESCHASVFHAMATITQIEIADGSRPVFSIGNL